MTIRNITIAFLFISSISTFAQKAPKIQAVWRSLSDYEATLSDKPDTSYLMKANRTVAQFLAIEENKKNTKALAYKTRISYYIHQNNLKEEQKKLEASISDRNARTEASYGSISVKDFQEAVQSLEKIKEIDSKYYTSLVEIMKGGSLPSEDDQKLSNVLAQVRVEASNIAVGKYKAKQFEDASDLFYYSGLLNIDITGKVDTSSFYNSCISAQKSKNAEKINKYNMFMIDRNISTPYNFQTLYDAKLVSGDNDGASTILKQGRAKFPNDVYLMNRETEIYLQKGDQTQALKNLQLAIEKDPKNAQLHLVLGNVYDNIANPKGLSGKDTTKPSDYEELVMKAATHYQTSIDLKPSSQESYFNALYNIGALYNNYGGTLYNKSMAKATISDLAKKQKEWELKSMEYYKKAIPYLEQALSIKPDDKSTIAALRKLYYLTGNEAKGKEMNDKMK
jgi:tetratricopeptide (TPR) repeat protein